MEYIARLSAIKKNKGICRSLNEALSVANGKYISMVASDDVWLPDKMERQVEILESQPASVGVLYSDAFQMDEYGHASTRYVHRSPPEAA